jgi:diacylglycerol kinase (ATP)
MPVYKHIEVIINPASGNNEPMLNILHDVFKDHEIDWDVSITKKAGDGARLAKAALERNVDLVAAYGGDGTLLDVAEGMVNTGKPMAFLPGGTANAMVDEMGIPNTLADAARLIVTPDAQTRSIDVGRTEKHLFLLRVGTGLVAEFSTAVNREMKDRFGLLAYFIGGFKALANPAKHTYRLKVDDQTAEVEAVALLITNGNAMGGGSPMTLSPYVKIDDGLLDVFALRGDLGSILGAVGNLVNIEALAVNIDHWQGRLIEVSTDEKLGFYADGEEEPIAHTPLKIEILPSALTVLVPAASISAPAGQTP